MWIAKASSMRADRLNVGRVTGGSGAVAYGKEVAPDAVTRILKSAVLDQFSRERNGTADVPSDHSTIPTVSTPLPMHDGALPAKAPAEGIQAGVADPAAKYQTVPVWKRAFDCAAIILSAPLWLPVMVVIMLGIKLSSSGPIFYRQERIGHCGRRFMIFKFRTMKVNVETSVHESYFARLIESNAPMTKLDTNGDPRLIGCGRFLRAAGLDELPQLINVLRGEMSLVGPRPCTVQEFGRYLPYQRERVNAPPGLTGYWQVNGKNRTTFSEMIEMDIFYANHLSLSLDLQILGKTLPAVLREVRESRGLAAWKTAQHPLGRLTQGADR